MLLLVTATAPWSASSAPSAIPKAPESPPMLYAFLLGLHGNAHGFHPRGVGYRAHSQRIHQHLNRLSRAPKITRMNLVQPANFRLRFSQFLHHAAKPAGPRRILKSVALVRLVQSKVLHASPLQAIDGGMKRLNLP